MKLVASRTIILIYILSMVGFMGCSNLAKGARQHSQQQTAVRMVRQNGETRVTCVFPSLTFDKLPFVVKTVIVRDASGDPLPASHQYGQSTVSFVTSDDELAKITFDIIYVDARALAWTSAGFMESPDWQVRFQQFKLIDALNSGEFIENRVSGL